MDSSHPETYFDECGISNHYWDFKRNVCSAWPILRRNAELSLRERLQKIKERGRGSKHDCIVGLSGGLDSSYMLHMLVNRYGMRPLVFHVDGGWNTAQASHNISVLIEGMGLELYTEVIRWEDMRNFQLALLRSGVPHQDIPQDMAFVSTMYKYAVENNIKTIMNGGNISTECVETPFRYLYWGSDLHHNQYLIDNFSDAKLESYKMTGVFYHKAWLPFIKQLKVIKPLNYIDYKKSNAEKELSELYGWRPFRQKHFESRFTRFFEGYWLPSRFRYDMRKNQLSSLILTGQMARETALEELKKPSLSKEEIKAEKKYICDKLVISMDELEHYHIMPRMYYYHYPNKARMIRMGHKALSIIKNARRGGAY